MWQVTEQDFDDPEKGPGRKVVELADGTHLSIITNVRNVFIQEARDVAAMFGGGFEYPLVQADDGEYEVAVIDDDGDYIVGPLKTEPLEWAEHRSTADGDVVYAHVTPEMIDALVNDIGIKEE